MAERFVAGLDGGGTKTAVCLKNTRGEILQRGEFGALNLNGGDKEQICRTVRDITAYCGLPESADLCDAICVGTAGVSNPAAAQMLVQLIREAGYHGPILLTGDHETALHGALGSSVGIALIAGTGSICLGRNEAGEEWRSGGWGYRIDDEGSGYAIGRDILSAAVRCMDGRLVDTCLKQAVTEQLRVNSAAGIVAFVHRADTTKKDIAALSFLLDAAERAGDAEAARIAQKAAQELVCLVRPVAERTDQTDGRIALLGSILRKSDTVRSRTAALLREEYPQMQIVSPRRDAAEGAADMAAEYILQGFTVCAVYN